MNWTSCAVLNSAEHSEVTIGRLKLDALSTSWNARALIQNALFLFRSLYITGTESKEQTGNPYRDALSGVPYLLFVYKFNNGTTFTPVRRALSKSAVGFWVIVSAQYKNLLTRGTTSSQIS